MAHGPPPDQPSVPFCSANRTLRDRAPGYNYVEKPLSLVVWVDPAELRKNKPKKQVEPWTSKGKRASRLSAVQAMNAIQWL